MDTQLKKQWVDALRSGKFSQVEGVLRCDTGHCAIGVLIEVTPDAVFRLNCGEWDIQFSDHIFFDDFLQSKGISGKVYSGVSDMNDNGKSFDEIADWIEANL